MAKPLAFTLNTDDKPHTMASNQSITFFVKDDQGKKQQVVIKGISAEIVVEVLATMMKSAKRDAEIAEILSKDDKAGEKDATPTSTLSGPRPPFPFKKSLKAKLSKDYQRSKKTGNTSDERTIGERLTALRKEARSLEFALQESDEENLEDEEDEYREADTETAVSLMQDLKEVEDPSPEVAALVVKYKGRTDWEGLDRAKDIKDELEKINEVYEASGLKDEGFESTMDSLGGWMNEL